MYALQGFATMERLLDGIHKIAVADMVAEASVRKHIRELYMRHAVLSTGMTCTNSRQCNQPHAPTHMMHKHRQGF